ncbi:ATP-binding protein [Proteinivorax hydrogeniformans]|uniref:endopeptidase La n=1 Tax=Proteinivorax hydrogeniformans TaxID=1826727 RepID=A0AAU8HR16_9FIRM
MDDRFCLRPEQLTSCCVTESLGFESTEEVEPLEGIIGQSRAVEALTFGLRVDKKGYNIFISGISGTGKSSYANSIAKSFAANGKKPDDWLYVFNFKNPDSPKAINTRGGEGESFVKEIEHLIEKLKKEIPKSFQNSEYKNKKKEIFKDIQLKQKIFVRNLNEVARKYGFVFKDSEQGFNHIPLKDGKPMSQKEYNNLSPEEVEEIKINSQKLDLITEDWFDELKELQEELEEKLDNLDKEQGRKLVEYYIKKISNSFEDNKKVKQFLKELKEDIVANISYFSKSNDSESKGEPLLPFIQTQSEEDFYNRYKVNHLVNNNETKAAPIVNETNPNFYNLNGAIEYKNEMGVLKTDFTQIKSGSIHLANGGYLLIQAKDLLVQPFAWETLKRTLKTGLINVEDLGKQLGYVYTTSLKPEPIPVDLKVILIGDDYTYHLLYHYDEDFRKLFKVMADFDIEMERSEENIVKMGQFIASHCKQVGLRDFDKSAVARVIRYSSRLCNSQEKLSSQFNQIVEILYESDVWAEMEKAEYVSKNHVEKAIEKKIYRNSKYEDKLNERFKDETVLIDVSGRKVGQINGLTVMNTGQHVFGKPSRITVSTYKGKSGIISIQRETKKSGSIYDKGVLTLCGYLGTKYAQDKPMSLTVSISFEQNYSKIDGDSASSTELYGIISSIAEVPIKQNIAVTGSINQKGEIQPVGGVNEKIEGFYDICKMRGLTGDQGVIIPKQNIKNLMLKEEVIAAVKNKEFFIYAINHVDEGIEILTDTPAGKKDKNGKYPKGTINAQVMKKLKKSEEES